MNPDRQQTLARPVTLDGTGVHSGEAARVTFHPAEPDSGVRFRRTDLDGAPEVPATLDHVVATELGTTVGAGEARVLTVEHLLAALASAGVDNARVDVEGPEIPIRDGSFRDFAEALSEAGTVAQDADVRRVCVRAPLEVRCSDGESYVALPADGLRISGTVDFEHPAIGRQFGSFDITPRAFREQIAPARTFGFVTQWDALREKGLALGANLENTIVLDEGEVLTEELRFPDEFLRHKVGDIVGDLALLGGRLHAHVVAERPSHAGNVQLARAVAEHARRSCRDSYVDVTRIMECLPHRYPMLLVDRIIDFEKGRRIVGIKNVTINEPFFQGHFPGQPVMPGVLIVEAMAQVGGLLLMEDVEDPEAKVVYLMSLDKVKFRRPVTPGDTVVFEVEMIQLRRKVCRMRGQGFVDGTLVAEAELMATLGDR